MSDILLNTAGAVEIQTGALRPTAQSANAAAPGISFLNILSAGVLQTGQSQLASSQGNTVLSQVDTGQTAPPSDEILLPVQEELQPIWTVADDDDSIEIDSTRDPIASEDTESLDSSNETDPSAVATEETIIRNSMPTFLWAPISANPQPAQGGYLSKEDSNIVGETNAVEQYSDSQITDRLASQAEVVQPFNFGELSSVNTIKRSSESNNIELLQPAAQNISAAKASSSDSMSYFLASADIVSLPLQPAAGMFYLESFGSTYRGLNWLDTSDYFGSSLIMEQKAEQLAFNASTVSRANKHLAAAPDLAANLAALASKTLASLPAIPSFGPAMIPELIFLSLYSFHKPDFFDSFAKGIFENQLDERASDFSGETGKQKQPIPEELSWPSEISADMPTLFSWDMFMNVADRSQVNYKI